MKTNLPVFHINPDYSLVFTEFPTNGQILKYFLFLRNSYKYNRHICASEVIKACKEQWGGEKNELISDGSLKIKMFKIYDKYLKLHTGRNRPNKKQRKHERDFIIHLQEIFNLKKSQDFQKFSRENSPVKPTETIKPIKTIETVKERKIQFLNRSDRKRKGLFYK